MLARYVILALMIVVPAQAQTTREPTGLSLQGETRMVLDRPAAAPGSERAEARLYARTQLKLRFVGETDGGLQFGAELDLDKLGESAPDRPRGQRVFIGN